MSTHATRRSPNGHGIRGWGHFYPSRGATLWITVAGCGCNAVLGIDSVEFQRSSGGEAAVGPSEGGTLTFGGRPETPVGGGLASPIAGAGATHGGSLGTSGAGGRDTDGSGGRAGIGGAPASAGAAPEFGGSATAGAADDPTAGAADNPTAGVAGSPATGGLVGVGGRGDLGGDGPVAGARAVGGVASSTIGGGGGGTSEGGLGGGLATLLLEDIGISGDGWTSIEDTDISVTFGGAALTFEREAGIEQRGWYEWNEGYITQRVFDTEQILVLADVSVHQGTVTDPGMFNSVGIWMGPADRPGTWTLAEFGFIGPATNAECPDSPRTSGWGAMVKRTEDGRTLRCERQRSTARTARLALCRFGHTFTMHALLGSEESWAAIDTSETDFPTWDGDTVVGLIANYWAEPYLPDMRVENVRAYSVVEAQGCSTETLNSVFR